MKILFYVLFIFIFNTFIKQTLTAQTTLKKSTISTKQLIPESVKQDLKKILQTPTGKQEFNKEISEIIKLISNPSAINKVKLKQKGFTIAQIKSLEKLMQNELTKDELTKNMQNITIHIDRSDKESPAPTTSETTSSDDSSDSKGLFSFIPASLMEEILVAGGAVAAIVIAKIKKMFWPKKPSGTETPIVPSKDSALTDEEKVKQEKSQVEAKKLKKDELKKTNKAKKRLEKENTSLKKQMEQSKIEQAKLQKELDLIKQKNIEPTLAKNEGAIASTVSSSSIPQKPPLATPLPEVTPTTNVSVVSEQEKLLKRLEVIKARGSQIQEMQKERDELSKQLEEIKIKRLAAEAQANESVAKAKDLETQKAQLEAQKLKIEVKDLEAKQARLREQELERMRIYSGIKPSIQTKLQDWVARARQRIATGSRLPRKTYSGVQYTRPK